MLNTRPVYRIGAAGLDPRDWRLIEIVFKHSQYNRFEFQLTPDADWASIDILIANTNDPAGMQAVSAVRTGNRPIPVISAVPRGALGAGRHAISIDRLTLQLLPILNRVAEVELNRGGGPRLAAGQAASGTQHPAAGAGATPAAPSIAAPSIASGSITSAASSSAGAAPAAPRWPATPAAELAAASAPLSFLKPAPGPALSFDGASASRADASAPATSAPATSAPAASSPAASAAVSSAAASTAAPSAAASPAPGRPAPLLPAYAPSLPSQLPSLPPLPSPISAATDRAKSTAAGTAASPGPANLALYPRGGVSAAPAPQQLRVLVVDDSPTVRQQLSLALMRMGLACDAVSSADDAIDRLADQHYDLALLDVVMPNVDGYKLTRHLKRDRQHRQMPVILLTSKSSPFDLVRGALAGCDTYLVKPVPLKALESALFKQLRKSLAIDDLSAMLRPLVVPAIVPSSVQGPATPFAAAGTSPAQTAPVTSAAQSTPAPQGQDGRELADSAGR